MWVKEQFGRWGRVAIGKAEIALLDKRPHNESVPEGETSEYQSW